MAATLSLVVADLNFGVPVYTDSTLILQNLDFNRDGKTAVVSGEDGSEIGLSVYGGQISEVTADYLFLTDDPGDIGDDVADSVGAALDITEAIILYGFGRKYTHEGFATGSFKAISLLGSS